MPPRGSRKTESKANSASAELQPNKRGLEGDPESLSPRRQSKRIKSTEHSRVGPSSSRSEAQVKREALSVEQTDTVSSQREDSTVTRKQASGKRTKQETSVEVKEVDGPSGATKTTPKKRKSKKDEAEMVPLRARTQGLRMFVGAHVSAAGGESLTCSLLGAGLILPGVFNAVNNSKHIGYGYPLLTIAPSLILRGNAFALFLKSQKKWANPPLQDEHRDNFLKLCKDHNYDAAKCVISRMVDSRSALMN